MIKLGDSYKLEKYICATTTYFPDLVQKLKLEKLNTI